MASLSPATWIGVGLIITLVAVFLPQMRVFVIPGIIFLLIGIAKLLWGRKPVPAENKDLYHKTSPRRDAQAQGQGKRTCFVCSAVNSMQANFCGHCGHKLR